MTQASLDGRLDEVLRVLAERVRRLREERGLTVLALSFEAGLSESRVRAIEAGRTTASLATLVALAETFEVEVAQLFGEAAPVPASPSPVPHSAYVVPSEVVWGGELPPAPWLTAAPAAAVVSPYVVPSEVVWGGELPAAPWTSARAAPTMPEPPDEPKAVVPAGRDETREVPRAVTRATEASWGGHLPPAPWTNVSEPSDIVPAPPAQTVVPAPPAPGHPHRRPADSGSPYVLKASGSAAMRQPRTFAELRQGALAGREFTSLREFAIAAVVDGGFSAVAVARVFRLPVWRLEQWVVEAGHIRR
ncbi:helix-turn-helix transcriptional regulator [Microbacterium sp. KSW2-29]|uniref:Helix-turn-helix transcriptional regulator n=1 Tax=Microbacterium phycohabitans TaxID=3075993 RepID=A0ABU3SIS0_9MICO|nr:helix-turn-helix transcriptional regulator [Microbacterium sp. KSW2-29]MDU0344694.1 helix-turn-helix transcriptional regulator [Microbacterium sp. KSW2-29]